jgi:response regulator RpfG family c-di-GMP phosphodiesterase
MKDASPTEPEPGMAASDVLTFSDERPAHSRPDAPPWKILIADDEPEVHSVTKLALSQFTFDGRPLEFLDTYSGHETVQALRQHPDIAIALVDVVMESDTAGLDAINAIRADLDNQMVRIVLRTGQPGQAPEREVVERYDINDYKEKTDLTATKLFTLVYTGLSQYRDMKLLQDERFGLQRIIAASSRLFEQRTPEQCALATLQEFSGLLDLSAAPRHATDGGLAVTCEGGQEPFIIASIGRFEGYAGQPLQQAVGLMTRRRIETVPSFGVWAQEADHFTAHLQLHADQRVLFHLVGQPPLRRLPHGLLDLFCANAVIAFDNTRLNREVDRTQSELVFMLSEAIEKRSNETGYHVRRVAEYSSLLGRLCGLPETEVEVLRLASPLHDAGKIGIPDAILNKPGRHTEAEKRVMDGHAQIGSEIFRKQTLPVLRAAAIVASQHHERWDGQGYPARLAGENIHLYGRITALADVFDALGSRRCYKEPWPLEDILGLIRIERGRQFDPRLVDLFFEHIDKFIEIRARYPDPPD